MSENVIEIDGLTRTFGKKTAVCDVSLNVRRSIVLGLVGENGAGKTTLIKHLLGLLKAQRGSVRVFGLNPVDDPVGVLGRIGYLSEERNLPDWMRIGELMRYIQAFFPKWDAAFAEELRRMFELDAQQKVKSLSRGQRARTGLMIAVAHRPDLLLLDEPSSGLDPIVRRDIMGEVIRTVADEGRTVLLSSHLLDEVERVCDAAAMMHQGRIVLSDSLDTIMESHHRLVLRFDSPRSDPPLLAGALTCTGEGKEWTVLCNGQSEAVKEAASTLGATVVDERRPSLDEIFVARVKKLAV